MPPLDLTRPRDLGDLVRTTLEVWSRHLVVLLALTAAVVVPTFLVLELAAGALTGEGADTLAGALLTLAVLLVAVQAVVTAFTVRAVQTAGRGEAPSAGAVARAALPAVPPVLAVIVVYVVGVGAKELGCNLNS